MSRLVRWVRRVLFGVLLLGVLCAAAYLVLAVIATKRLSRELGQARAAGAVLVPGDAAPPPVPDEDNAAVELERAFALVAEEPDEIWYPDLWEPLQDDPARLSAEHVALLTSWVAANEDAVAVTGAALERPHCLFRYDWSRGYETISVHVPGVQVLSRVLSIRGYLRIREGDVDGALADALTLFRLGRAVRSQSTAIDLLVGMGIQDVGLRVARKALAIARPSADAVEEWLPVLDAARGDRPLEAVFGFERALGNLAFEMWRAGELDESQYGVLDGDQSVVAGIGTFVFDGPAGQLDHARFLATMAEILELANRPYRETRETWEALACASEARPWYDRLTWSCLAVHTRVRMHWERHLAGVDLARIALRVELHDLREDRLPAALEELDIPGGVRDRFGDSHYVYRPELDGGYVLYSVGGNGLDEGGEESEDPLEEGDLVWRRPPRRS